MVDRPRRINVNERTKGIEAMSKAADNILQQEVDKRRTFAIISHPDAGKTTLTEKLLLFGAQFVSPVQSKLGKLANMQQVTGWKLRNNGGSR